jgi:hypothetical protein
LLKPEEEELQHGMVKSSKYLKPTLVDVLADWLGLLFSGKVTSNCTFIEPENNGCDMIN